MTAMLTCPNCGSRVAENDSFCGVCGEFLAWETTTAPVRADPTPAPVRADTAPVEPVLSERRPVERLEPASEPAEGQSRVDQPGAVLPGRPVSARPVVRQFVDEPAALGDVICPVCGTPNRRERRFCRRCGTALGYTERVTDRLPWWRRIRLRPRLGSLQSLVRLLVMLAVLVVIAAAGYVVVTHGPRVVEAVRDRMAKPERIAPTTITASSEAPGHPASEAVDGLSNRYWAPVAPGQADGQYLEMTFDRPIRLLDVIVHAGISPQQDQFVREARPAVLDLTAWTSSGTSTTKSLRLADRPGKQRFHHVVGSVTRLRFTIRSSYGANGDRRSALAEIELFRRP